MNDKDANSNQPCYFFKFGLFVTGEGERNHLPKLFKSLTKSGICSFEVIRFIGQRSPITSDKKKLKMVGSGKTIPDRDVQEIGMPARTYLSENRCAYVLLVDDLEHDRRNQAQEIFNRYRQAFDKILQEEKHRASVHFLVNMLEAYYFADAVAINKVLETCLSDYSGDVETIRHPKNELKKLYPGFDEVENGGSILDCLNIEHVLSRRDTCASLRTIFAWCSKVLEQCAISLAENQSPVDSYRLQDGILSEITKSQLDDLITP
jgi:hypothetical protein